MKKQRLFKDHPEGLQLHAGNFRGKRVWNSDDGGKSWWCGYLFSNEAKVTRKELIEMVVSILQDTPNAPHEPRRDSGVALDGDVGNSGGSDNG